MIGERTAEAIKIELGSAYPLDEPLSYEVRGRNLIEGIPKTITITDEEVREALADSISTIINAVRVALERTPPELSADIVERGIVLTGGGALLKNLDKRLSIETWLAGVTRRRPPCVGRVGHRQDAFRLRFAQTREVGKHDDQRDVGSLSQSTDFSRWLLFAHKKRFDSELPLWLVTLLVANLVIMAVDARDADGRQKILRVWTQTFASPLQNASSKATGATSGFFRRSGTSAASRARTNNSKSV